MLSQKTWGLVAVFVLTLFLAACGGSGNSGFVDGGTGGGDGGGGDPDPTPTPTRTPAFLFLNSSSAQLANDADQANEGVAITAIVTDSSGNVIQDVALAFAIAPGSGALAPAGTVTDATGSLSAILTTGGNSTLRTITVTGSVSGLPAQSVTVQVVGSGTPPAVATPAALQLVASATRLSADADTAAEGSNLTAFVTTAAGTLVPDVSVQFSVLPVAGFRPGALQVTRGATDDTGSASAILTTGGNSAAGVIRVEARIVTPTGPIAQIIDVQIVNAATSIRLFSTSASLFDDADSAAEGLSITAVATNAQGNTVSGVLVSFSLLAPDNVGALQVTGNPTDTSGLASALLTTGGITTPRMITVEVSVDTGVETLTATASISVVRRINSLSLLVGSPQLLSNADDAANGVTVTAVVRDANQNAVPNVAVSFSTADAADILVANPALTDTNGRVQAIVTTASDPTNRLITISANAATVTDSVQIAVVGTTLTIQGPANTQIGVPAPYTISLSNGDGGIAGRSVTVSTQPGNVLSSVSLITDASGQAIVTLTPIVADSSLTAMSLGLTATQNIKVSMDQFRFIAPAAVPPSTSATVPINIRRQLRVQWLRSGVPVPDGTVVNFAATRGVLSAPQASTVGGVAIVNIVSDRAGSATVQASSTALSRPSAVVELLFVASQAATLALEAEPTVLSVTRTSSITATVLDPANNVVAGKTVEFSLTDNTGGSLSSPTAITDALGKARVTYSPGPVPSAADGVTITAIARNDDASTASGNAALTVTDGALRISLQTGNELLEPDETRYQLPYLAIVTDAAGNPTPGASFQLSVFPTVYFKGYYVGSPPIPLTTAACANEDLNRDGILEAGEDVNGNGVLDPGNVASVPVSPALGADGTVQFNITYGQNRGNWIQLELTGRAAVDGSEDTERALFIVPISQPDVSNPPGTQYEEAERDIDVNGDGIKNGRFIGSPYGISTSCADTR